ncbi:MAG: periplasmic heavy metal sensor [Bacteroidales bacterium]|nr:MAG: periplasmic heavy metal sensor [Bacteroidales bacterium]
MKTYFNKYRILIWLIIILLVINISAITTIFLGVSLKDKKDIRPLPPKTEHRRHHEGEFFYRSLNLSEEQHQQFKKAKHKFYSGAKNIAGQMHRKRIEFINELASEEPDTIKLQEIANEIGALHSKLKFQTYRHYLDMKRICTEEQEEELMKIFKSMLYKEDSFMSPRGRHGGKGKRPHHHR